MAANNLQQEAGAWLQVHSCGQGPIYTGKPVICLAFIPLIHGK